LFCVTSWATDSDDLFRFICYTHFDIAYNFAIKIIFKKLKFKIENILFEFWTSQNKVLWWLLRNKNYILPIFQFFHIPLFTIFLVHMLSSFTFNLKVISWYFCPTIFHSHTLTDNPLIIIKRWRFFDAPLQLLAFLYFYHKSLKGDYFPSMHSYKYWFEAQIFYPNVYLHDPKTSEWRSIQ